MNTPQLVCLVNTVAFLTTIYYPIALAALSAVGSFLSRWAADHPAELLRLVSNIARFSWSWRRSQKATDQPLPTPLQHLRYPRRRTKRRRK